MLFKKVFYGVLLAMTFADAKVEKHERSQKVKDALAHMSDDFSNERVEEGDSSYAHELEHLSLRMDEHVIEGSVYKTYGASVFLYDSVKILP